MNQGIVLTYRVVRFCVLPTCSGATKQMPVRTYLDTTVVPVLRQVCIIQSSLDCSQRFDPVCNKINGKKLRDIQPCSCEDFFLQESSLDVSALGYFDV